MGSLYVISQIAMTIFLAACAALSFGTAVGISSLKVDRSKLNLRIFVFLTCLVVAFGLGYLTVASGMSVISDLSSIK